MDQQVYLEANNDATRSDSRRFTRSAAATSASTLSGSFPTLIQPPVGCGHVGNIVDRRTTNSVAVSPASRLAFQSPASTQLATVAASDIARGRLPAGAARAAVSAVQTTTLPSTVSVGSMPSPRVSSTARKVWRAAHQRRNDNELPVGVGSFGSSVRQSRDVSMETTGGGDVEESRVIIIIIIHSS